MLFSPLTQLPLKLEDFQKGADRPELVASAFVQLDSRVLIRLKTIKTHSTAVKHTGRGSVSLKNYLIYGGKSVLKSPHFLKHGSTGYFFFLFFLNCICITFAPLTLGETV